MLKEFGMCLVWVLYLELNYIRKINIHKLMGPECCIKINRETFDAKLKKSEGKQKNQKFSSLNGFFTSQLER